MRTLEEIINRNDYSRLIMRTLEEIINRNDYSRLTVTLNKRVQQLAKLVRNKMVDLDLAELKNFPYAIRTLHTSSCGDYSFLGNEYGESLEDNSNYYYCGDFNARVYAALNRSKLGFLNNAKAILQELDETETRQVEEINKAIDGTKEI
jgi:hypothetical protein